MVSYGSRSSWLEIGYAAERAKGDSQLNVFQLQILQTLVHSRRNIGPTVLDFGSDKQLLPRQSAYLDRGCQLPFCTVGVGTIQVSEMFPKRRGQNIYQGRVERIFRVIFVPRGASSRTNLDKESGRLMRFCMSR